ncbi:SH3 domain-containing protein [bacterium]|nr:SH3 domain-containing protein [bacterium]
MRNVFSLRSILSVFVFFVMICDFPIFPEEPSSSKSAEVSGVSTAAPYGGNLLVFNAPSQSATKIGFISNGDSVQVEKVEGNFARVTCTKFPSGGWVWGSYLKFKEEPSSQTQGGEPVLLKILKETEDISLSRNPERMRVILPRVDPNLVASFIRMIQRDLTP